MKQLLIQEYQERWPEDFEKIKQVLLEPFRENKIRIEHIGSTAIKQLAAKPIIDIDIVYAAPQSFEAINTGLRQLGYYHNGDQGIVGREVFKRNKQKDAHPILDSIQHHLYVCSIDSEELHRHLTFRDFLRNNEKEREAYETLKFQIAAKAHQDKKTYAGLKEVMARAFITSIIKQANKK